MAQFYADRVALGSRRAKTPEGYLLCTGVPFARTGFQLYRESEIREGGDPNKEVKVLRTAEEVLHPKTLASFEGKPITSPHPPRFVDPDNFEQYARGHVQNVRMSPEKLPDGEIALIGDLLITHSGLISKVESNLVTELSAGYNTEYVPDDHAPDVYRQTNIRGNHIAVVPSGRAGNSVKILDTKEETVPDPAVSPDEKVSLNTITSLFNWFRTLGRDSESESVERNKEYNQEALERAKRRNEDSAPEEEKMKKGKDAEEKKEKESSEKEEKSAFKEATDAFNRAIDRLAKVLDKKMKDDDDEEEEEEEEKPKGKAKDDDEEEKKKTKDRSKSYDDDEEEEKKEKHEEEDADLIAVETLSREDRPKNPIPGADKALDYLRAIKPVIAQHGSRKAKDAFNEAVRQLKNGTATDDDLSALLRSDKSKPTDVRTQEDKTKVLAFGTTDAKAGDDFVNAASKFHRKNVNEAAAERRAGKE